MYLLGVGYREPQGIYVAPSFTALYIEGVGIEKLIEGIEGEY